MDATANASDMTNGLLATIDRMGKSISMLNTLVNMVMDRVAPIRSVAAACDGQICVQQCEPEWDCCVTVHRMMRVTYRAIPVYGCDNADWCGGPCNSPYCVGGC
jgi:hypothetical protein